MKKLQEFLNTKGAKLNPDGVIGKLTMEAATKYLKDECSKLGHIWLNKNIIGLRMGTKFTNAFTDFGFIISGGVVTGIMPWTTVPGRYYVYNPLTVGGVTGAAVLVPGQYVNSHVFRKNYTNKWGSPYFEHIGTFKIYRDANKDDIINTGKIHDSPPWHGIFLHQMGTVFGNIWNWSAGCQGTLSSEWTKVVAQFNEGEKISYTLIQG